MVSPANANHAQQDGQQGQDEDQDAAPLLAKKRPRSRRQPQEAQQNERDTDPDKNGRAESEKGANGSRCCSKKIGRSPSVTSRSSTSPVMGPSRQATDPQ